MCYSECRIHKRMAIATVLQHNNGLYINCNFTRCITSKRAITYHDISLHRTSLTCTLTGEAFTSTQAVTVISISS